MVLRRALIRAIVTGVVLIALTTAALLIFRAFYAPEPESGFKLLKATVQELKQPDICLMPDCASLERDFDYVGGTTDPDS